MTSIRKSPNMMSAIGRIPVIAAPTQRPVKPTSEIGVSMMRLGPNSSTSPLSTLKVVPASATSSPIRTTVGSRRISSAIASRTASPKPISFAASRVGAAVAVAASGIDVLGHAARIRVGRADRKLHRRIHLFHQLFLYRVERRAVGQTVVHQPLAVQRDRILLRDPLLLFRLRPVVGAGDVADVMTVVAVGDALQERRALAAASAFDVVRGRLMDGTHVLAVDGMRRDAECLGARRDVAGRGLLEVR